MVAEVPVNERLQGTYMLHSMAHWQKTVHGYSGMRPPLSSDLYQEMASFPDTTSLAHLSSLGVTQVIIHTDYYEPGEWALVEKRLTDYTNWLSLEHTEGGGRAYALHPPAALGARTEGAVLESGANAIGLR